MSSISAERIIEGIQTLIQDQVASGPQEEVPAKVVQQRAEVRTARTQLESLENQRLNLKAEARGQHRKRFEPLRAILDPLADLMQVLRDAYFSGREISAADVYYDDRQKKYARGLMIPAEADGSRRIIYAVATCVEPAQYFLNIGEREEYQDPESYIFRDSLSWRSSSNPRRDIYNITGYQEPFGVRNSKIYFYSPINFLPQLSASDLKQAIPVANPETFVAENAEVIEERFKHLLAPWARQQLMAQASASA